MSTFIRAKYVFLRVNSITFNNKFEETLKCCENPTLLTFKSLLIIYCYNCRTWIGSRENVNSYCRQFRPFTKGCYYGITLPTKLRSQFSHLMEFNLPSYRFKNFPWRNQIDFVTTDLSYYSTCNQSNLPFRYSVALEVNFKKFSSFVTLHFYWGLHFSAFRFLCFSFQKF